MRFSIQEVEIGPFLIDLTTGRILRNGLELALRPQAFRVLKTLIQNSGQYVDFERMIAEAWEGIVVSRHTVDVTVGEVKKVFQEFGSWIAHRPKLGYRLEVPKSEALVRKGWHFWNRRTREGFEKAIESFQDALVEDGTDFRAYEGLAASYVLMGTYGMRPPNEVYPLFLNALSRAAALTGWTPELRAHRAHGLHIFERKFDEAETEFLQAQREKPTVPRAYCHLALLYVTMARFEEALGVLGQGYKIDPLWPLLPATEVCVRFYSRDFESAIECGRKAVELHPYITVGRCFYAQALEYAGRIEEALREYQIASVMSPGMVWLRLLEGTCLARNGRPDEARTILEQMRKVRETEYIDAYYLALLHDSLGQRDLALQELERAYDENSAPICLMDVDAKMDLLRQDSRFDDLRKNRFGQLSPWDSSRKLTAPV